MSQSSLLIVGRRLLLERSVILWVSYFLSGEFLLPSSASTMSIVMPIIVVFEEPK